MSDIVERLNTVSPDDYADCAAVMDEAAAEITRLRADRDAGAKDYCALMDRYDHLRAENERLSKAMTDLLWYVAQLETLAYDKDDAGEHESVTRARAALKENSDE